MSASNNPPPTPSQPPLGNKAKDHAQQLCRNFQADLLAVSQAAARNSGAELILIPHVNEAMTTLRRFGLKRGIRFWERPDFKVGIGGLLFGLGPTAASVAKDLIESGGRQLKDYQFEMWAFMILPMVILLSVGLGFVFWGWTQTDGHS